MAGLSRAARHEDVHWRRAVAAVLVDFPGEPSDMIARHLVDDMDADVHAMAANYLRCR
jgi:hypothetical protein